MLFYFPLLFGGFFGSGV
uniref:Uncharacterized protein n=1 Tax=Arundo donax TaxID=35708 RepID=A0A0A9ELZ5_ARUDO